MGMQNPVVNDPIDKLAEVYPEGTPFFLTGIRTVKARTADFGEGEMVLVRARDHERELGIWGSYILAQAKSADTSDLNQWYVVRRRVIEGFGKGRPVKVLDLAPLPPHAPQTPEATV
ncbi:MAG: hypothetical protein KGL39_32175 [Patescibacteria group bacterium]|nr:hypothetical protein [Patescibacteria group bacterium]